LENAYSLRFFPVATDGFKYHPVTYVVRRSSRNKLEAIDARDARDGSRHAAQSTNHFDICVERLSTGAPANDRILLRKRSRSHKPHRAVML
jgi:hypothetical protein